MRNPVFLINIIALIIITASAFSQNIEAKITGLRSRQGQIFIKVYKDEKSFADDKPFLIKKFAKTAMSNSEMLVKFSLDPGTYGLALLDDENSDSEMNYNFLGMPQEGFGFSNYELKGLSRPKLNDFRIVVNANSKQKVNIKVTYL